MSKLFDGETGVEIATSPDAMLQDGKEPGYRRVDECPPPRDGTWFLLRGRNAANVPMIPVVVAWCSFRRGDAVAFRDSASLRDMGHLLMDVPHGSSADWCPLPAETSE